MRRFIHIGFAFAGVPKVLDLEPIINLFGTDWIRYSSTNWIVWTDKDAATIYWTLSPALDVNDNVFIAPIDASAVFGRMPPWIWEWMQKRQATITTTVPPPPQSLLPILPR